ncbi:ABC transporter ATP-binding protein [Chromobacterium vaccinii]|uniref:ABC transporter ATP-binding protein n=1 Tax=Chromobacterium vaccinii TaxID=1108595 RepID=UPI003C7282EA
MKNATDSPFASLLSLLAGYRLKLGVAVLLAIAAAGLELLPYGLLCASFGLLLAGAGADAFLRLCLWLALALAGKYLLYSIAYFLSHGAAYQILMQTRQRLARRMAWAPLPWLQRHGSGELKKLLMQDVERLEQFIAHHLVEMAAALAAPALTAAVLVWLDWRLALAALATLPLAILFQTFALGDMDARMHRYQQAVADLNNASVEYLRGIAVMRAFRQDARSSERMRGALRRYGELIEGVTRGTVPGWSVFMVLLNANIVFLLPLGLWLLQRGEIDLSGLLLAVLLGNGMLKPLFKLMRFQGQIREILDGVGRMLPLLALRPPEAGDGGSPDGRDVALEGVSFRYGERAALRDCTLSAPAGSMTALVGPSGAGKSTVAALLGGLIEAQQGRVRIGGADLAGLDEARRAGLVAVASQHPFLFRGSLLDNLKLANPNADEAALRRALRIAQAEELVDALPDGVNCVVGERGDGLSGGERQRIAIARALLADTPVLVLDECTAFADSRTEQRFFRQLRKECSGKTLLVIAHRLYTISDADRIVVLDGGEAVDAGRHDELLERCSLYRDMWQAQALAESWALAGTEGAVAMEDGHA